MDDARRIASSMAVRDGNIVAIGDAPTVDKCKGPGTRVLDFHQQTVLPGLIDVQTHAIGWAETVVRNDVAAGYPKVHSIADIVKAVAERSATAKPGEWIQGSGWDESKLAEHRYLNKSDLDSYANQLFVAGSFARGALRKSALSQIEFAGTWWLWL